MTIFLHRLIHKQHEIVRIFLCPMIIPLYVNPNRCFSAYQLFVYCLYLFTMEVALEATPEAFFERRTGMPNINEIYIDLEL